MTKVYPSRMNSMPYPAPNINHMVLWVRPGYKSVIIDEMHNKPKELCWHWINEHKHDSDYAGGKLIAVAVKYVPKGER